MSKNTNITVSVADLQALAQKISGSERSNLSKPEVLNMVASTVLGPKHDWARIKNAEVDVVSQRVAGQGNPQPAHFESAHVTLHDEDGGFHGTDGDPYHPLEATVTSRDDGLHIETDDGHTVWVEKNGGCLKVHVYNDISDGPATICSRPGHRPQVSLEGWEDTLFPGQENAPVAEDETWKQVQPCMSK